MESRRSALRALMVELGRASSALERGAFDEARQSIEAALSIDRQNVRALQLREQLERSLARGSAPGDASVGGPTLAPSDPRRHEGWSAFEHRIRERRAARCVETAQTAVLRGDVVAAREALDELAALVPSHAALSGLRLLLERTEPVADTDEAQVREAGVAAREDDGAQPVAPSPIEWPPSLDQHPTAAVVPPDVSVMEPRPAQVARARSASPRPTPSSWRRRPLPAVMAAAAVLVFGVLLPFELTDTTDVSRQEAPQTRLVATLSDEGDSATAGGVDAGVMDLAAPEDAPLVTAPPDEQVAAPDEQVSGADAALAENAPVEVQPVMTSGASVSAGRDSAPAGAVEAADGPDRRSSAVAVARPTPDITDPSPSGRAATSAREIARAAAAQRALLTPPPVAADAPSAEPPAAQVEGSAPELTEPAATLARLGAPAAAALTTSTPAAPAPPSATASAAYVPPPPSGASRGVAPVEPPPGEAAVRDVLQRYVTAYNRLDAVAAQAVWPAVNQGALQRAFAQLDSQTLRFERCEIDVDDEAGFATCAGQARWVPRVGTRDPKREQRTWRFELARNGEDWIITRAEARR